MESLEISDGKTEMEHEMHEDIRATFDLFDRDGSGYIETKELIWILESTGRNPEEAAKMIERIDPNGNGRATFEEFKALLEESIKLNARMLRKDNAAGVPGDQNRQQSIVTLLCILDDFRRRCEAEGDYVTANNVKRRFKALHAMEESRQHDNIAARQNAERSGVEEAHMMEAMEFNSAWSQNMSEFERQAREIEEQTKERQLIEFKKFQSQLRAQATFKMKFSRELLNLRKIQETLAKQGEYAEAQKVKAKADEMEKWERMKLDNELQCYYAAKELQLKKKQQQELEALQKRIQRGRDEHKEHWLIGAQRLMQSHRNMLNDLKNRQNIENIRAVTSVKADLSPARAKPKARGIKGKTSPPRNRPSKQIL